ncbi:6-phosphogluconolactonase [Paractinoplanes rishiriensis]|uniref:6-phosphogluconolactonase n=1 Tax=Paractinoplanes rishiriensis TaxID=1050105 RepID=A0A919K5I2_9ACTN|nr:6-phosphogluconolactonase [Actinoplanes rishiriensis]GIE97001.1 6-phosphogluconolactonase [Actinoplanes rishiriensis]
MSKTLVVVVPDADVLAATVASRLVSKIVDAQAERGTAGIVLTGGRIAAKVLRTVKDLPTAAAIDWSHVDLWWGDERFLPAGHADRNETQARAALLDELPLDRARVHPMPATDGPDGDDATAAAARYAEELKIGGADLPPIDVLMLGVGEDGHVASLFPEHPVLNDTSGTTAAVFDSPKPPPTRITLTMPTIQSADEVWLIAAGPDKTDSVGAALNGDKALPAAHAVGRTRTYWLLDQAAAAKIP